MKDKSMLSAVLIILFSIHFSCKEEVATLKENDVLTDAITIGKSVRIFSEALNENRALMISLPQNYERNIHRYPIIFVLDAEYLFELTHSIVRLKVSRNEMPESIIVGIPNTDDGRYDMAMELKYEDGRTFFGDAKGEKINAYLDFIRHELIPYLNSEYRVNAHHTIIGMSPTLGPVFEAFWNQPDLFRGYIALAPELAVTTNTGKTVKERLLKTAQNDFQEKSSMYIGKASDDLKRRPKEEDLAYKMLNDALKESAGNNINFKIEVLDNENHYGMAIKGIEHGLETIYPNDLWTIPYNDFRKSEDPAKAIQQYYDQLSKAYGFQIIPQEDAFYFVQTLSGTIRRLHRQGETKKALNVVKLGLDYYPNSEKLKEWLQRLSP